MTGCREREREAGHDFISLIKTMNQKSMSEKFCKQKKMLEDEIFKKLGVHSGFVFDQALNCHRFVMRVCSAKLLILIVKL